MGISSLGHDVNTGPQNRLFKTRPPRNRIKPETSLFDEDKMHFNDGRTIREKYGFDEKLSLYLWWKIFEELQTELRGKKEFDQAKILMTTAEKAIEPAYNYYGITPEKISAKLVVVVFSLVFYLIYTVWYGFSILYIFESLGFSFNH
jgi:hypothetical protein